MQVAVMLLAAKFLGGLCARYLKQPSVLGELVAGMIIGPFALGGLSFLGLGPLFPLRRGRGTLWPPSRNLSPFKSSRLGYCSSSR